MPTTTTPATNTNTTPLSAMTGEEVASILVGLIRQNDGVLIQQKVTDGINQSNLIALYNELVSGKSAIRTAINERGGSLSANATLIDFANAIEQSLALNFGISEFSRTPKDLVDVMNNPSIVTLVDCSKNEGFDFNKFTGAVAAYTSGNIDLSLSVAKNSANTVIKYLECNSTTAQAAYGNMSNLRHLICHNAIGVSDGGGVISASSLYDYRPFSDTGITGSINLSSQYRTLWYPSTALSTSSSSLCNKDRWDDQNEPTSSFQCNRDKFVWYFEHKTLPLFVTATTSTPLLTIHTSFYNALASIQSQQQPTKTLLELITDKGWEVSPAN